MTIFYHIKNLKQIKFKKIVENSIYLDINIIYSKMKIVFLIFSNKRKLF